MLNQEKTTLRQKTMARYTMSAIRRGLKRLLDSRRDCYNSILIALCVLGILVCLAWEMTVQFRFLLPLYEASAVLLWLFGVVLALYFYGSIPHARRILDNLLRIGVVNYVGEVPLPVSVKAIQNNVTEITFFCRGLAYSDWVAWKPKLETAMDISILHIYAADQPSMIRIEYAPGIGAFPAVCLLPPECLSDKDFQLALGVDAAGRTVYIDLAKTPHLLICGATGMGKSKMAQALAWQIQERHADLVIADWKGGLDYPAELRTDCRLVTDEDALLLVLDEFMERLDHRRRLFVECGVSDIQEYNRTASVPISRSILLVDEASIILDTTGRTKADKDEVAEILNGLNTIGRLARAFGLHLIICTQRADVGSIPGSLKAQLDGRISAHAADDQSSIVIMGDNSAAELPSVPGRFIMRDITGDSIVFQAYMIPKEYFRCKREGVKM